MRNAAARRPLHRISGLGILQILILAYFAALAPGLVSGADIGLLATPFLPPLPARSVAGFVVLALVAAVAADHKRRAALLMLALVIFWASYISILTAHAHADVGAFWRDLASIGLLLLAFRDEAFGHDARRGGRRRPIAALMRALQLRRPQPADGAADSGAAQLFREDFDAVRHP